MVEIYLDPSKNAWGWVVLKDNKIYKVGVFDCPKKLNNENITDYDIRFCDSISRNLVQLIQVYNPKFIGSETFTGTKSSNAMKYLAYCRATIISVTKTLNIKLDLVIPSKIKKYLTGDSFSDKENLLKCINENKESKEFFDLLATSCKTKKDREAVIDAWAVYLYIKDNK